MQNTSKLGEDRDITGLVPALVTLVLIAVVWLLLGAEAAFKCAFLAFCVFTSFALVAYLRTRNIGYMASTFYLLACSLMLAVRTGFIPGDRTVAPAFAILLMVSIIFLVFMLLTRQTKWRGRDILELAAQPVDEVIEGYTARPHPAGKAEYTRNEITDFANFARRKLIAWTFVERDRVIFVPVKMGNEFGYLFSPNRGYDGATWVAFDNEGNITVNISEADYLAFREDFDFDRLCSSLADVFVDFLDMHRKGQDTRIMDRLDAMKIGLFS
ncbi:MAG: hypothetical protein GY732_10115 [Gammaproteobacteria bacterium]|nr:hypothetical protein [Gammaproteobacteria bacterium]